MAIDVFERLRATKFEQTRCDVDRQNLLRHHFSLGQSWVTYQQWDADAGLMRRALVNHAVLTLEQAIITHEYDDCIVELLRFFEISEQAADAVIHTENRAPVTMDHVLEIFHCLGTIVRKLFAPIK